MASRSKVNWFWLAGAASALLFLQPQTLGLKTAYAVEAVPALTSVTVTPGCSIDLTAAATSETIATLMECRTTG